MYTLSRIASCYPGSMASSAVVDTVAAFGYTTHKACPLPIWPCLRKPLVPSEHAVEAGSLGAIGTSHPSCSKLPTGGVIFATSLPTCNESTYDFFVVHRSLAHAIFGVQRVEDGGCTPHWQSRLLIRGDARRLAVRKLVKPTKVAASLPFGPQHPPPS